MPIELNIQKAIHASRSASLEKNS